MMDSKRLIRKAAGIFAGNEEVLRMELSIMNSPGEVDKAIRDYRETNIKRMVILLAVMVVLVLIAAVGEMINRSELTEIHRPGAGEGNTSIPVRVEAEYNGAKITREVTLKVAATDRTDEEREQQLEAFAEVLPDRIAPLKNGIRVVTLNLDLPEKDSETGIEINWTSSRPDILDEKGCVDVTQLEAQSCIVDLTADLRLQNQTGQTTFSVVVMNDSELYGTSINKQLDDVISSIAGSSEGDRVVLPKKTETGVELNWETGTGSTVPLIIVMGIAVLLFLYNGRYERAKKASREYRASVIADFPNVIDKLVLLLNSGLTVLSALKRLSEEYENERHRNEPLGRELAEIGRRVRNTNASIIDEWKGFAARMGSADILRFCTILEDNLSKGSELCRKLENESESFMDMRRKSIQQHIRMIDSKMTMPMILMLLSLILVTISPVITGF